MRLAINLTLLAVFVSAVAAAAETIPLTPRPHMDAATLELYNRIRTADGVLLGLGEIFAPPVTGQRWEPLYDNSMQRWQEFYGERLPACYEFDMGERNQAAAVREWPAARSYADSGGVVWLQLSLNNLSVPYGGRQGQTVVGGMQDTRGGLAAVLPGGDAHDAFVAYMRQFAREVKAFDKPCVLRPFHEMNGGWFWWGAQPERYKVLWSSVFELFSEEGVHNVIWCWAPSAETPRPEAYYPGDDLVDIIGTSQYFSSPRMPERVLTGLSAIAQLGPDKPLWLAELGPLASSEFWQNVYSDFAKIQRLRGLNLWLARGWRSWGGKPGVGSLIDSTSPPEVQQAFSGFLDDNRTLTLQRWNGLAADGPK